MGTPHQSQPASTTGSFVYTPVVGTILNVGANQPLSVAFTPADAIDYTTATTSTAITVNPAVGTLTLSNLTQTYDGAAKNPSIATNPSGLSVLLTYNDSSTAPINASSYNALAP